MKVAIYFDSKSLARDWSLDLSCQSLSGTDSMIIQLFIGIRELIPDTFLLCTSLPKEPSNNICFVESLDRAIEFNENNGSNFFIINHSKFDTNYFEQYRTKNIRVRLILWAHNSPNIEWCNEAVKSSFFYKLIFVSNEQRFSFAYHPIFKKSVAIYNFLDEKSIPNSLFNNKIDFNKIIFVGALVPEKGFHHIAESWKKVHINCPELRLDVCGSPKVYRSNYKLGTEGIAAEQYELEILSHLGGSRDSALKLGVNFLGSVGKEDIYKKISESNFVLVNPNTNGSIETFCVSAIEGMILKRPIIGGCAGGLLDVVGDNEAGILIRNPKKIHSAIINLYKNNDLRNLLSFKSRIRFEENFEKKIVLKSWIRLLNDNYTTSKFTLKSPRRVMLFYLKSLIRVSFPLSFITFLKNIKK